MLHVVASNYIQLYLKAEKVSKEIWQMQRQEVRSLLGVLVYILRISNETSAQPDRET